MERRMYAFNSEDTYYVPNSTGETLLVVPENIKDMWMTQSQLEALTSKTLKLVAGMDLVIYTTIEDDEYTVRLNKYDVTTTTDDTHISMKGTKCINKVTMTGSSSCKAMFSFDNRQHWYNFDTTTNEFKRANLGNIHEDGIPIATVQNITSAQWDQIFTRTFLDYAVCVDAGEQFTDITVNLPGNTPPEIRKLELDIHATHRENINMAILVEDLEEDEMSYQLFVNNSEEPYVESNLNPLSHGQIEIEIQNEDLNIGTNTLKFVILDEKGASREQTVTVTKTNALPQAFLTLNNDILTLLISDAEEDNVRYKLELNDEVLIPMTEFQAVPIRLKYHLPRNKIIFGQQNTLKLTYEDDVKKYQTSTSTLNFVGSYYGVLFASASEDDGTGSIFYSDSLGGILKKLEYANFYRDGQTPATEIYVLNRSSENVGDIVVYPQYESANVDVELSELRTPFEPLESITLSDIEYGGYKTFFVRLKAKNGYVGIFKGKILADAYESDKPIEETPSEPEE